LTIIFESPHRLPQTLADLEAMLGGNYVIGVGRELTKAHEELVVGPISEAVRRFREPRGEFTLLIPPAASSSSESGEQPTAESLRSELGRMAKSEGFRRRAALKTLAARYGMSVNALYRLLERGDDDGQKT
jgi:16S rRNA (cytidine1402-2'-O)-methyltransferase